jgi:hypothetical protein
MFHFGRRHEHPSAELPPADPPADVPPADLPRPGVGDAVRAFAYDALRTGTNACWLTIASALVDAIDPLLEAVPDLRTSGVRWTGAGVLPSSRAEWWAFDGGDSGASVLVFTGDGLEIERLGLVFRRTMRDAVVQETSTTRRIPRPTLEAAAAARALPVWEVTGFSRLAPRALLETGFATIAA